MIFLTTQFAEPLSHTQNDAGRIGSGSQVSSVPLEAPRPESLLTSVATIMAESLMGSRCVSLKTPPEDSSTHHPGRHSCNPRTCISDRGLPNSRHAELLRSSHGAPPLYRSSL